MRDLIFRCMGVLHRLHVNLCELLIDLPDLAGKLSLNVDLVSF